MTALWTAEAAQAATGGQGPLGWAATGVSIDTRTLQPGDLFVALVAERDGHDFVAQALDKGAAAALVTHRPEGVREGAPLLNVTDTLVGLSALGAAARARTEARVLAITGSVGKTSTKEMARAALGAAGRVHAAEASYNNHWGVPLTLARMPAETDFAVIEIGMSTPGEIAPLARLARPDVAIVTTVAAAHLEAFGSLDRIAAEKASIFEGLAPGMGCAVLNADLPQTPILSAKARASGVDAVTFGRARGADWRLSDLSLGEAATQFTGSGAYGSVSVTLGGPGAHHAQNALSVIAAAAALGIDPALAAQGLGTWQPPEGRGTRETLSLAPGVEITLLDDAFNANPASLAASLEVFANVSSAARRIAILGDMLELGAEEATLHAAVAQHPAFSEIDVVHCVGPRMAHLWEALPWERRGYQVAAVEDLVPHLPGLLAHGDSVLVKGSKGSYVSRAVDALRKLSHSE